MSPNELLLQLRATASPRRAKSLEIVNQACSDEYESGRKDFAVATIGDRSQKLRGPGRQAIYNRTGDDYKALIKAWAQCGNGVVKSVARGKPNDAIQTALRSISDPAMRALVGTIFAENTKLRGEVNLLKQTANIVVDQRVYADSEAGSAAQRLRRVELSSSERSALEHAASERCLANEGWRSDEHGRIVNAKTGRVIFKIGFLTAIRKVLDQNQLDRSEHEHERTSQEVSVAV